MNRKVHCIVFFLPFYQKLFMPQTCRCQKRQWSIVGFLAVSRGRFVTCLNIGRFCHRGLGPGPLLVRSQGCGFRSFHGEKYSLKCEEERRKLINVRNIALEPLHGRCSGFSLWYTFDSALLQTVLPRYRMNKFPIHYPLCRTTNQMPLFAPVSQKPKFLNSHSVLYIRGINVYSCHRWSEWKL